jgi:flagellar biogenesis protein FliO
LCSSEGNRSMSVTSQLVQFRALALLVALTAAWPISAETATSPPALPPWLDQTPSVYSARAAGDQPAEPQSKSATPAVLEPPPIATPVEPAQAPQNDPRRLAPQRHRLSPNAAERDRAQSKPEPLPSFGMPLDSIYTTLTALAVVVGLFLLCAGLVRRSATKSSGRLPEEVVSVLGRVPLAARQFAQLVRVGNKLVLLSVTSAGAEPLTEITDPVEIDRLLGLCRQTSAHSSTAEFDQIFHELAQESAPAGFLGNAGDIFASYRGGAARG